MAEEFETIPESKDPAVQPDEMQQLHVIDQIDSPTPDTKREIYLGIIKRLEERNAKEIEAGPSVRDLLSRMDQLVSKDYDINEENMTNDELFEKDLELDEKWSSGFLKMMKFGYDEAESTIDRDTFERALNSLNTSRRNKSLKTGMDTVALSHRN